MNSLLVAVDNVNPHDVGHGAVTAFDDRRRIRRQRYRARVVASTLYRLPYTAFGPLFRLLLRPYWGVRLYEPFGRRASYGTLKGDRPTISYLLPNRLPLRLLCRSCSADCNSNDVFFDLRADSQSWSEKGGYFDPTAIEGGCRSAFPHEHLRLQHPAKITSPTVQADEHTRSLSTDIVVVSTAVFMSPDDS